MTPHGSYPRVHPVGTRVARFRCPLARETISLLPAFLAARYSATLDEIEQVVDVVEVSSSRAAAAENLRPADDPRAVTSISAMRWVRRRMKAVLVALRALVTLVPELLGCAPTLHALRAHLGVERVLVRLRTLASSSIRALAPPLGLSARGRR